jgi:hypothetical protein
VSDAEALDIGTDIAEERLGVEALDIGTDIAEERLGVLGFTQPLTEMSTRDRNIMLLGRVRLITLPPSLSRLSRHCGNLNIS